LNQANRLNICVIPDGKGQVRNFQFSPVMLVVMTSLFFTALVLLSVYALHSYQVMSRFVDRSGEVETLKTANIALEARTAAFSKALDVLEEKLRRLSELTDDRAALTAEVRVQLGLPPETPEAELLPRLAAAVAWAGSPGLDGDPENPESGSRHLIRNLNQDMERLMALAEQAELDLTTINDGLRGAGSILAATPTILPLNLFAISSKFGLRQSPFGGRNDLHRGIDIPAPIGTLVRTPADGVVLATGHSVGGYGLLLTIDHGYGLITRYGHLESTLVEAGQVVLRGQPVARSGNSGRSTGPHLHYEVLLGGVPTNPLEILAAAAPELLQEVKIQGGAGGRAAQSSGGATEP